MRCPISEKSKNVFVHSHLYPAFDHSTATGPGDWTRGDESGSEEIEGDPIRRVPCLPGKCPSEASGMAGDLDGEDVGQELILTPEHNNIDEGEWDADTHGDAGAE